MEKRTGRTQRCSARLFVGRSEVVAAILKGLAV